MNKSKILKSRLSVCFVQPIQSPYWTERLNSLATHEEVELTLLLERASFAHRPGWIPEPIEGVAVEILGSSVVNSIRNGEDLGYKIKSIRSIPWRLPLVLQRLRPNIVVVCNATQLLLVLPLKLLYTIKIVLIVEDTPHATRNLSWLAKNVKGFVYRKADQSFAFSEDAKNFLKQIRVKKNIERSSWSLDMLKFIPNPEKMEFVKKQQFKKSSKTVVFVGSLVVNKGVRQLLDSWQALPGKVRENSKLVLVGSGSLHEEIEQFLLVNTLNEVQLLGQIPYLQVRDLLQKADLLVLPTLQDLFSLTVLEAMACGCPVITTPFNGARELIEENITGWIVDPTKEGALTKTLVHALSEATNLQEMGIAAREKVRQMNNYSVMNKFLDSLRKLF